MADEKASRLAEVLREFKEKNPWQGKIQERKDKFTWMNDQMNRIFDKSIRLEFDIPDRFSQWHYSGNSYWQPLLNKIVLKGRLSVVTFLHEWAHVLMPEASQEEIQAWAKMLFGLVFPEKMANLETDGYMIKKRKSEGNEIR